MDSAGETAATAMPPDFETTPLDRGRFVAGTMLAGRYRIVGLIGKGGMGEVYRAEDLKLRQLVALKFLPDALSADGPMLARFHREVRAARQITHANVCRVHDIGETAIGRLPVQFLSMEYIDGEDLAALLRRIGHLSVQKGVELARQLCAGLAAAHEVGMVHRDLKPANIMLDGRGRARITDFGLSGLAEEFRGDESSGTPAYMAPEQLRGAPATTASDIYALGLVLYEVFTGKRPFEGKSVADLIDQQERNIPPPSTRIRETDPLIERAILRCLAPRPADRPKSPFEVAAALPGGDPLAAALAAGETPSPQMVAASGKHEGLRPALAWVLLAGSVSVLLAAGWFLNPVKVRSAALATPPEVLADKAAEFLDQLGSSTPRQDFAYGFERDEEFVSWAARRPDEVVQDQHGWVRFWYCDSPKTLTPTFLHPIGPLYAAPESRITSQDPPLLKPGMRCVRLDVITGGLLEFNAVPTPETEPPNPPMDASLLWETAQLSPQAFAPAVPKRPGITGSDRHEAWSRTDGATEHVETAFWQGRPVHFALLGRPWFERAQADGSTEREALNAITITVVVIFVMLGGAMLAWRNIQAGRGDRRGAFRLALFAFVTLMLAWIFGSDHRFDPKELYLYLNAVAQALYWSTMAGVMYLAVEPFIRQRWPDALISWNRLLDGRFRDSLGGRDALIGVCFAALVCMVKIAFARLEVSPPLLPEPDVLRMINSNAQAMAFLLRTVFDSVNISLALFFLFSFFRAILRNQWIAIVPWIVLINWLTNLLDPQVSGYFFVSLFGLLWLLAVMRFGLIAGMAMWFADRIFRVEIMLAPQGWYAGRMYLLIGAAAALSIYAFRTSLGNHPIFSLKVMDVKE